MIRKIDALLYDTLIEKGIVSKEILNTLLKQTESSGQSFAQLLVNHHPLLERDILKILAEKLKLSFFSLKGQNIDPSLLNKVPAKIACYYHFIPVQINDKILTIAVSLPLDIKTQDEIRTQLGYEIEMVLSTREDLVEGLKRYYGFEGESLKKIVAEVPKTEMPPQEPTQEKVEDLEKLAGEASVIKLVNQIILDAYRKRSTDIHIEPYRQGVSLRYRVDGILYDAHVPPEIKNFLNAIVSRIKIMSNLNIVERRLPQDGRAVVRVQEEVLDLRISTLPTPFGESVVIRILPTQMLFSLEKLGLSKKRLQIFQTLIQKPHGILFVTGPTGSGKTTTLYTCLSYLNTKDRKIITIEDPIEYEMSGITQVQVMPEIGLDFACGLRSMLRHDPDVMMVGEVRDLETAEIAIRVALTGHLVFSTLHTNDAASGVTRLIDIGVEPYLIASSVETFIAQRLVRVICSDCKYEDNSAPIELKELMMRDLGLSSMREVRIFKGKGCQNCNQTGFFGRSAIYEILLINEAMKDLILKKCTSSQIKRLAVANDMETLRQDGWQKVMAGITTPEEILEVTPAEEPINGTPKINREELNSSRSEVSPETPLSLESDKRVYSRLSSSVHLRYKIFNAKEESLKSKFSVDQFSITKNISAGGLLLISTEPVLIGAVLELKIELPDAEAPIECLARVVRVEERDDGKKYNIAVCFLDITGAQRARLNQHIELALKE